MNTNLQSEYADIEPQPFNRSYSWPRRQIINPEEAESSGSSSEIPLEEKNNFCHRNPWGSFSYADLITRAIESSPFKRLTLAQIYDWMNQERGKYFLWMLNSEAPGKNVRRRSNSLSINTEVKKKGKLRKTFLIIKKLLPGIPDGPRVSKKLDLLQETDYVYFRPRSNSNCSTEQLAGYLLQTAKIST
ncbi:unnamed protein product [Brassicogethes aeneus]|uniref:Fork-head domain-containing protein n=1 Tax=Brassicogethes aeneus TaxID=1431903 RepID=A0A9P0BEW2_BRAAE|nr:unnamed protein product [Brassicogethes aeneus]